MSVKLFCSNSSVKSLTCINCLKKEIKRLTVDGVIHILVERFSSSLKTEQQKETERKHQRRSIRRLSGAFEKNDKGFNWRV